MTDDGKPTGRGQLRKPVSIACCRWTPINFAEIRSGKAATAPNADQGQTGPSDAACAGNPTDLLKTL